MRIRRRSLRKGLVAVGCLAVVLPSFASGAGRARWVIVVALLVAGSALHLWSKGCLEQNRRLTTAGPYRFTRNPFYLANLLIDAGLCALIGRWWIALPYAALFGLAYSDTIRREERRLAALFPAEFARYVAVVPRLIPNGRALPRAEAVGGFRFTNPALAQGAEYPRILGIAISAATLAAAAWIRAWGLAALRPEHRVGLAWVLLIPIAWIVKLVLAAVLRRPRDSK